MSDLKVGDKVRLLRSQENDDLKSYSDSPAFNEVYTVQAATKHGTVTLAEIPTSWWNFSRFEKVLTDKTEFKVGDWARCVCARYFFGKDGTTPRLDEAYLVTGVERGGEAIRLSGLLGQWTSSYFTLAPSRPESAAPKFSDVKVKVLDLDGEIKVGDTVCCTEPDGISPRFNLDHWKEYVVAEVGGYRNSYRLIGCGDLRYSAYRFKKVVEVNSNPCVQYGAAYDLDYKSRYENLLKEHNDTKSRLIKKLRDAQQDLERSRADHRLSLETQKRYDDEVAKVLGAQNGKGPDAKTETAWGAACRVGPAYQKLDRETFKAEHYNWARRGLTWEEAARDLYNYILRGRGLDPLPKTAKLLPSPLDVVLRMKVKGVSIYPALFDLFTPNLFDYTLRPWPPRMNQPVKPVVDKVEPGEISAPTITSDSKKG